MLTSSTHYYGRLQRYCGRLQHYMVHCSKTYCRSGHIANRNTTYCRPQHYLLPTTTLLMPEHFFRLEFAPSDEFIDGVEVKLPPMSIDAIVVLRRAALQRLRY